MNYVEAYRREYHGDRASFGIKVLVSTGRPVTEGDTSMLNSKADEIYEAVMAETVRLDPEVTKRKATERARLVHLFSSPVFVEEVPNAYCSRWCCLGRPWFLVTTPAGRIKIGWRKHVIQIDWESSVITETAAVLFPSEDVTKVGRMIHAWGYDDARRYITVLMVAPSAVRAYATSYVAEMNEESGHIKGT